MSGRDLASVYAYIDDHAGETVELLRRLCRQPSISAQNVGLSEMADLTREVLAEYGFTARLMPTATGVPVVYGELPGQRPDRTLLVYNHYDVQPPEPLDLWTTPPFEPAIRDGRVYARGATDNKGNIASRLAAVQALRATGYGVPVTLKYLIEGQEEISSPGLPAFLDAHQAMLTADGCLWEDTMGRVDAPIVSLGNKGMCKVELRAKVASTDSHSAYAGIYPNAIWRLVWALAAIKDPEGRVLVPGFYDDIRGLDPAEEAAVEALPPTDTDHLKRVRGIARLVPGIDDGNLHRRQTLEPTCNLSGIGGGYTGPGTKTVTPAEAFARIDMRLVPDQDPDQLVKLIRAHLDRLGFDDIEVVHVESAFPSRTRLDTRLNRAIAEASLAVYGKPAIVEPHQAGSTPQWMIDRHLGIPCSATGVGYVTSMTHAPDENIRIDQLIEGAKYMATIFAAFAAD